ALLKHSDPYVRLWTIRLVGDFGDLYDFDQKLFLAQALVDLARVEAHVEVRCQLASTAKRLGKTGHSITKELLLRDVDADDPFIPMLLWWAIESNCHYRDELVDHWPRLLAMLFKNGSAWNKEIVKRHILERLVKRFAMTGSRRDLVFCAKLVESAPSNEVRSLVIKGFEGAYRGRSMPRLPQRLIDAISSSKTVPLFLGIRIGDKDATARGLKLIMDKKVDQLQRVACIQTLGTARIAGSVPALLSVTESEDAAVRRAAYAAIQRFDNSEISNELIGRLDRSPRNVVRMIVGVLATREKWSLQLLEAVEKKKINRPPIPRQTIIQMRRHKDIRIAGMLLDLYGGVQIETPDQMKAAIRKYSTVLLTGDSDPYSGQKLFEENCERCHKLFDKGGSIGPELTAYNRGDTERMLHNIVNPSAEIREGFENYILTTIDGRKLSGFLVDRDAKVTVLRGIDGQDVVVEKDDVDEMRPMDMSLMPEGLLKPYTDQQVRDLFAYLRSAQPLNN
ncbi:MAG: HEAT repeat domain-containing protein, partial [Pirellulaceae bacterium]|nr:HEAT repeat domain-containing protein [Pirellulaceae bacterium]